MAKEPEPNPRLPELSPEDASFAGVWLQPKEIANDQLHMSSGILRRTLTGLKKRSAGWRESGAIWAGDLEEVKSTVREVFFYHDLCDDQGRALSLELSEAAKFSLYRELAARGMKLVGMIHTHPEDWVGLSYIDKANQLCSRIGFWSLVVPYYAKRKWDINTTGVHCRISRGWHQFQPSEAAERIIIK
jgi:proteasome lid subunit RPN8/RPN11